MNRTVFPTEEFAPQHVTRGYKRIRKEIIDAIKAIKQPIHLVKPDHKNTVDRSIQFEDIIEAHLINYLELVPYDETELFTPEELNHIKTIINDKSQKSIVIKNPAFGDYIVRYPFGRGNSPDFLVGIDNYLFVIECKCDDGRTTIGAGGLYPLYVYANYYHTVDLLDVFGGDTSDDPTERPLYKQFVEERKAFYAKYNTAFRADFINYGGRLTAYEVAQKDALRLTKRLSKKNVS